MKALTVATLLFTLAACGSAGADSAAPAPAPRAASGKPLPFAPPPPPMPDEEVVCAADVRLCANGSYVRRNPVKGCAFELCPGPGSRT